MRIVTVKNADYTKQINYAALAAGTVSGVWDGELPEEHGERVGSQPSVDNAVNH